MCLNFVDLNQMTKEAKYVMKDTSQLIDLWRDATIGSLLDMKACYYNTVVEPSTEELLGVTTQDGVFTFKRMPFDVA